MAIEQNLFLRNMYVCISKYKLFYDVKCYVFHTIKWLNGNGLLN